MRMGVVRWALSSAAIQKADVEDVQDVEDVELDDIKPPYIYIL